VTPAGPWWGRPRAAALLVAALIAAAYARSLGNAFTYDEGLVIVEAQRFLRSGAVGALFGRQYFAASLEGTWRPLCTLTYMIDAAIGFYPAVFKADSIAWHIGAALLVMAVARRLLPEGRRRFALVAGLLFALHPLATETVDNASFREDALVTFFVLATLLLACWPGPASAAARPERDRRRRALALVTLALALLSKESAVVAPLLVAVVLVVWGGRSWRAAARETAPLVAVTLAYLAIRFGPMRTPVAYGVYPGGTLAGTLVGMPAVWLHDLRLLVFPWPLCADYTGYFRFGAQPALPVLGALVVLAAVAAAAVVAARRGQVLVAFGLAWFAIALGPVSNLVPVPVPAAERFLYLPLAGIALAAAAGASTLAERLAPARTRALAAAGAALLGVFVAVINVRHGAWRDDETLWKQTVAVNPRSCGAQSAVGGRLLSRAIEGGGPDLLREAIARQETALGLCPDATDRAQAAIAYTRLGAAHALLGELDAASIALVRATELAPRYALPVVWLGYVRSQAGDPAQAAALLKRAVIDLGPPNQAVAEVAQRYLDKI
jgi:tetratricopeptide (TPR) repeat protein